MRVKLVKIFKYSSDRNIIFTIKYGSIFFFDIVMCSWCRRGGLLAKHAGELNIILRDS